MITKKIKIDNDGANDTTLNASAILEVNATDKGVLLPRMTNSQMLAIASPATGLLVYQTDGVSGLYQYNGTAWVGFGNISGSGTNGTLPKFTGSGTLGNSTITEDSNSVTLGKTFIVGSNGLRWAASAITSALPTLPSIATWAPFTTDSGKRLGLYSNISSYSSILSNDESTVWFTDTTSGSYLRYPDATLIGTPKGALGASSAYSGNDCVLKITGYRSVGSADYFIAWAYLSGSAVTSLYFEKDPNNTTSLNIAIDASKIKVTGSSNIRCTIEPIINYSAVGLDTHHVKYYYGTDGQLLQWKGTAGIQVGTGTKSASAVLQADSTTQGFLPPRMTSAQMAAIASPVAGLLVYQTDVHAGYWYHDGTIWQDLSQPRVGTTASSATPTINTDVTDYYEITGQTVDITSFTTNLTGTPVRGQKLWIDITGTAARAITWGASFEASTIALPTTTVTTDKLSVEFIWNVATSKWRCIGTC